MIDDLPVRTGYSDATDVRIYYEDLGDPAAPPLLLIMGFSAQLTAWPDDFCRLLVAAGYRVIRFDNRDIGLSGRLKGVRAEGNTFLNVARFWTLGRPGNAPYLLTDMAADTVGVLDHLGIESAHVVGASMGGMIAQIVAGKHPSRVRSLGLVFTSTNEPFLPPPSPRCLNGLFGGPGANATREQRIQFSVDFLRTISGSKYRIPDGELRAEAEVAYERGYYPAGIIRQLAATLATGSLAGFARQVECPTVVLHGTDDPLVRPQGGAAVAKAIKHAKFFRIEGWGHNLPAELQPYLAGLLTTNAVSA